MPVPVFPIRISLNADPDPGFYLNADQDSGFRILIPGLFCLKIKIDGNFIKCQVFLALFSLFDSLCY